MTTPANRCSGHGRRGEQLCLLDEAPFSARLPKPATLAAKLLTRLLAGERITHRTFDRDTQSWRLAAYVFDLRELGWPVETVEIPAPSPDHPGRCIAEYHLPHWAIAMQEAA